MMIMCMNFHKEWKQRKTFESQFEGDEQEDFPVRSIAPQLNDDELKDKRMQEER